MPVPKISFRSETYNIFMNPLREILPEVPLLSSRGEKPLSITSEHQLNALIWYHLKEHESLRDLTKTISQDRTSLPPAVSAGAGLRKQSVIAGLNSFGLSSKDPAYYPAALSRNSTPNPEILS